MAHHIFKYIFQNYTHGSVNNYFIGFAKFTFLVTELEKIKPVYAPKDFFEVSSIRCILFTDLKTSG